MCIALSKKIDKCVKREILENCFQNNSDGAGFAYIKNGELFIAKGFFDFESFWRYYSVLEKQTILIHFRVGTSGSTGGVCTHPWRVNNNLAFIHNGIISIERTNQSLSDTGNFNDNVLKPLMNEAPDYWKSPEFKWIIENSIGSNNKLVFADNTGHTVIFNEKEGKWEDDVWYSNNSFSYSKYKWKNGTTYYSGCGQSQNPCTNNFVENNDIEIEEANSSIEDDFKELNVDEIDRRLEAAENKRLSLTT